MRKLCDINSNYIGTPEAWCEFLVAWSELRLRSYDLLVQQEKISWDVKEGLIEQDLTEFQPKSAKAMQANLELIEKYETKHQKLPKSYRDFMIATNGDVPTWFFYDEFCSNQEERYETQIYSINQLGDIREHEEAFYFHYIQNKLDAYEKSDAKYYEIYQYYPVAKYIQRTLGKTCDITEKYYDDLMQHEMQFYAKPNEAQQYAMHGYTREQRLLDTVVKIGETSINEDFTYLLLMPNEITKDNEWESYEVNASEPEIGRYISFVYLVIRKFMLQVTPYQSESQSFKYHYYEQLGCDPADLVKLLIVKI